MNARDDFNQTLRGLVSHVPIITYADNCEARGDRDLADRIRKTADEYHESSYITISDAIFKPYRMVIKLSKVPRGYVMDTAVPDGYQGSFMELCATYMLSMSAFWREWRADHAEFNAPDIITYNTSAHWGNADDQYWVGLVAALIDSDGREYRFK